MGICENVTKLRKLSGMTQEQFGELAGVTRAAVSQWEGKRAEPRSSAIKNLCIHFGLRRADLIEDGGMDDAIVTQRGVITFRSTGIKKLSDDEAKLVRIYRDLDDYSKYALMVTAAAFAGEKEENVAGVETRSA